MRGRSWLLAVGFGLLLAAWVVGSPLIGAPDETAHYYKALGAAYGQWSGTPAVTLGPERAPRDQFLAAMSRNFRLPPRYAVQTGRPGERLECITFNPASARCQYGTAALPPVRDPVPVPSVWAGPAPTGPPPVSGVLPSYVGSYPPYVYLPAGLAARLTAGGRSGLRAARAAFALTCLVLIAGAARCCRERAAAVGLLAALTPTCVFLAGSVTSSGPEIAGAVCAFSAGLALLRDPARRECWAWLAAGGAVLATSRVLGPVFLAALVVLLVGLVGPAGSRAVVRGRPRAVLAGGGVLALAALATLGWDAVALPRVPGPHGRAVAGLIPAVGSLPRMAAEMVGWFGWVDTPMPPAFYAVALAAGLGLFGLALAAADTRQRVALALAALGTGVTAVLVDALTQHPFGFVSHGRYSLAVAVAVPLLCGHVLAVRSAELPPKVLRVGLALVALGAVAGQLGGWYAQAHHYAVGLDGPVWFLTRQQWQPPGGWLPWLGCLLAGAALLLAGALGRPATDPGRA
ncbi:MAG: hypothetical protein NVSMB13_06570 [Mycobacteriales bacterium]